MTACVPPDRLKRSWRSRARLIVAIGMLQLPSAAMADAWPPLVAPSLADKPAVAAGTNAPRPPRAPEAEPSDDDPHYERICDAFGEGFSYSPGSGACIKIGGSVKFGTSFGSRRSTRTD